MTEASYTHVAGAVTEEQQERAMRLRVELGDQAGVMATLILAGLVDQAHAAGLNITLTRPTGDAVVVQVHGPRSHIGRGGAAILGTLRKVAQARGLLDEFARLLR